MRTRDACNRSDHPEMDRNDEPIRQRIAADAYDLATA
jgi:hypothetical protein